MWEESTGYRYPINGDKLKVGKFCSIACGAKFLFTSANHTIVGGIPAKPIRKRFSDEVISRLLELQRLELVRKQDQRK